MDNGSTNQCEYVEPRLWRESTTNQTGITYERDLGWTVNGRPSGMDVQQAWQEELEKWKEIRRRWPDKQWFKKFEKKRSKK